MNTFMMRIFLPVFLLAVTVGNVLAAPSSGETGKMLAQGMYCDTKGLLEGNIGLILGLLLVFMGVWALVQGAKMMAALPVILIGSLVTALPTVIESSFQGLGALLADPGVKISTKTFSPPECKTTPTTPSTSDMDKLYQNQDGVFYPGRGSYYPVLPEIGPVPTPRPPTP